MSSKPDELIKRIRTDGGKRTGPPPISENVFKPQQGEGPESSSSGDADTGNSSSDESGDNTGDNDK